MFRIAIFYAGSALTLKLLGLLLSLWLARVLMPEDYGIWGLALAIQIGVTTFGAVGIPESLVGLLHQYPSKSDRQHLYAAATGSFFLTLTVSLVFAISLLFLVLDSRGFSLFGYVGIIISGSLLALTVIQAQVARLEENHLTSLVFSFLIPLAGVTGSAIGFGLAQSVDAYFFGSGLAMLIVALIFYRSFQGLVFTAKEVAVTRNKLTRRLTPFVLVAFLGWLSGYGHNVVVAYFFNLQDVAQLTFLMNLGAGLQLLTSSCNQVWSPRFYSLINSEYDPEKIERMSRRFYSALGLGLGIVSAIGTAAMPDIVGLIGGQLTNYRYAQMEMLLIFMGYIALVPWVQCQNYLLVKDQGKLLMNVVFLTSLVGLTVWGCLMLVYGTKGIYLGFFVQMLLRSIGISVVTRRWCARPSWGATGGGLLLACSGLLLPVS